MSMPVPCRKLVVCKSGIPWEMLPLELDCGSGVTCWRCLHHWQGAGACDVIVREMHQPAQRSAGSACVGSRGERRLQQNDHSASHSQNNRGSRALVRSVGCPHPPARGLPPSVALRPGNDTQSLAHVYGLLPTPEHSSNMRCLHRPFDTQGSLNRNAIYGVTRLWQSGRPNRWI